MNTGEHSHLHIGVNISERKSGTERTKKRKKRELVFPPPPGGANGTVVHVDSNNVYKCECDQFKQLWHSRITCEFRVLP